jgi:hypothetical protein
MSAAPIGAARSTFRQRLLHRGLCVRRRSLDASKVTLSPIAQKTLARHRVELPRHVAAQSLGGKMSCGVLRRPPLCAQP